MDQLLEVTSREAGWLERGVEIGERGVHARVDQ
jgi:hypothetical protein